MADFTAAGHIIGIDAPTVHPWPPPDQGAVHPSHVRNLPKPEGSRATVTCEDAVFRVYIPPRASKPASFAWSIVAVLLLAGSSVAFTYIIILVSGSGLPWWQILLSVTLPLVWVVLTLVAIRHFWEVVRLQVDPEKLVFTRSVLGIPFRATRPRGDILYVTLDIQRQMNVNGTDVVPRLQCLVVAGVGRRHEFRFGAQLSNSENAWIMSEFARSLQVPVRFGRLESANG